MHPLALILLIIIVTATQSRYEHGITRMQTCTIGMSMDADIKIRSRRRWKKGHVYIHSAKSVSEPLTRLPCPYNAVISVFRNGAVTGAQFTSFTRVGRRIKEAFGQFLYKGINQ